MPLNVKQVEKLVREATPGLTPDGNGLYLKVSPGGAASWAYRYQIAGKRRLMGLGACAQVSLAEARERAAEARKKATGGIDPIAARDAAAKDKRAVTFSMAAKDFIEDHKAGWRNAKHSQQWTNTLKTYVEPKLGGKLVESITTEDVLDVLRPIWTKTPETARRVRNRMELVINAARAKGLSSAPNPAIWRGHLDKLLPKRTTTSKGHHAAMDYSIAPGFFQRLVKERDSKSSLALQLTILTACRTSEVLMAKREEFDLDANIWTIPGERMKAGKPHRVPLSKKAVALVNELLKSNLEQSAGLLFPGARKDRPLSNMSMTMVLRKLGHADLTVHGFRSTFRDWAAEETHYPNIVAEQALAHAVGSAVEAAYRRGDLIEKRRSLMEDWSMFLQEPATTEGSGAVEDMAA